MFPDYSEFFIQKEQFIPYIKEKLRLPIEGGRGCHWGKCHFCYLNKGYRYRPKSSKSIIDEFEYLISTYKIYDFIFLDNDIIGKDISLFDELLNQLIQLKEKYPDFKILLAEIITKDINHSLIRKMRLAGFAHVQIGYESPSNELLSKIEKKNTFASNLFFIKFARKYRISIGGANIIRGMLEETTDDIYEAIQNLHPLRFFNDGSTFYHSPTSLGITESSRYYKQLDETQLKLWNYDHLSMFLPKSFIKHENAYKIAEGINRVYNPLWDNFGELDKYYRASEYKYELIQSNQNVYYTEYYNKGTINKLEFQLDSIEWAILSILNLQIMSLNDLFDELSSKYDINNTQLSDILNSLKCESLIYFPKDISEIVSVIDTSLLV